MKKVFIISCFILGFTFWCTAQNGLHFDGVDDVVQTSYGGVLGDADRTFEAWVFINSDAPESNLAILDYGVNVAGSRNTFAVSNTRALRFTSGGVTNSNIGTEENAVPIDQWAHVAFVLDNGIGRLYVNGMQMGVGSLSFVDTPTNAQDVKIGERVFGGSIPFQGIIDEVRVWDVARTPNEIESNMNLGFCSGEPNLQLNLQFDEGMAGGNNIGITTAIDVSGNDYDGILNNFDLTGTTSNWVDGSGISSEASTAFVEEMACNLYVFSPTSTIYTESGIYTELLVEANAVGCDSLVILDLTIFENTSFTDVQTACGSYTWIDGNTYMESTNNVTLSLTNAAGCDSLVILDLTIANSTSFTDIQTACGSYTWIDGNTYTENTNNATFLLTNATGCDSLVTLDLTIANNTSFTDVQTACGSYIWIDGNTYTESTNNTTYTLSNTAGCDSLVTLDLTIANSTSFTDVQTACGSYTWIDGNTYTESNNNATLLLTNAAGCDSLINLDLSINTVEASVIQEGELLTANEIGGTYQWVSCPEMTPINGATNQSYTAEANGDFALIVSNDLCADTSMCYTVSSVGIITNEFEKDLLVFPNPTNGECSIDMGEKLPTATVMIKDVNGKTVWSNTFNNSQLLKVKLEEPSGVYLLIVESENKKAVIRLIKK